MSVLHVLNYIPKAELEKLSLEYKVDYQVKKLDGQTMFQLLLFSMLNVKQNSLRVMEEFYPIAQIYPRTRNVSADLQSVPAK
ncbi:DUF4372 domain-containing protein [Flavobacterium ustbae]|uniref:DUF4372 domain-containing protein n=1 Tax=Flavobacterium ustbae TaxID=2488790 RepID=UPI000F77DB9C|nr:DUF4372 domain-containing protein [Flavobacterium ustbae]